MLPLKAHLLKKVALVAYQIKPLPINSNYHLQKRRNNLKTILLRLKLRTKPSNRHQLPLKKLKSTKSKFRSLQRLTNNIIKENQLNKSQLI